MKDKTFLYLIQRIMLILTGEQQIFPHITPWGEVACHPLYESGHCPQQQGSWQHLPSLDLTDMVCYRDTQPTPGLIPFQHCQPECCLSPGRPCEASLLPPQLSFLPALPGALMAILGSTQHHRLKWYVLLHSLLLAMQWPNNITQGWALPRDSGNSKLVLRDLMWLTEEINP